MVLPAALALVAGCFGGGDPGGEGTRTGQEIAFLGAFARVGGAPQLTECETGIVYPMLTEGDFATLEAAYQEVSAGTNQPVQVSFSGRIEQRPGSDGNPHDVLRVEAFETVHVNAACGASEPLPPLEGSDWRAVRLLGNTISGDDPPTLALDPQHGLLGWTGCRPVTGAYTLRGGQLNFGAIQRPEIPCEGSLRYEQLYLGVLQGTGSFQMTRDTLFLVGESGVVGAFVSG